MANPRSRATSTRKTTKPASAAKTTRSSRSTRSSGDGQPTQQFDQPQVVMTASHDEIARRAYEIWLSKGRPIGQDEQNWREAEAALQMEVQQSAR